MLFSLSSNSTGKSSSNVTSNATYKHNRPPRPSQYRYTDAYDHATLITWKIFLFWLHLSWGTICSTVFLLSHFWPIDIFIVELCVVSFKCSSSVEYIIKKIFLKFVFSTDFSRFKIYCTFDWFPLFCWFSVIFAQNLINFAKHTWKMLTIVLVLVHLQIRELLKCFTRLFSDKFLKIRPFSVNNVNQ